MHHFKRALSSEVETGLDHLFGILRLGALSDGSSLLHSDLLLQGVFVVESDGLVKGQRLLVLVLELSFHASVLEAVVAHLVPALVLLRTISLCVYAFLEAVKSHCEFLPGNAPVLVGVKLFHEQLNLLFKGWEAICVVEEVFNFFCSDVTAAILVASLEASFKFVLGEDVDAKRVHKGSLELIGGSKGRYTEE